MASEKDTKDPWAHDEFADESCLVVLSEPVTYDDEKSIRGLVHSPYVLGAALLASFGGFSFGYGTHKWTHSYDYLLTLAISRSGRYLPHFGHASVPSAVSRNVS